MRKLTDAQLRQLTASPAPTGDTAVPMLFKEHVHALGPYTLSGLLAKNTEFSMKDLASSVWPLPMLSELKGLITTRLPACDGLTEEQRGAMKQWWLSCLETALHQRVRWAIVLAQVVRAGCFALNLHGLLGVCGVCVVCQLKDAAAMDGTAAASASSGDSRFDLPVVQHIHTQRFTYLFVAGVSLAPLLRHLSAAAKEGKEVTFADVAMFDPVLARHLCKQPPLENGDAWGVFARYQQWLKGLSTEQLATVLVCFGCLHARLWLLLTSFVVLLGAAQQCSMLSCVVLYVPGSRL